jgi:hypothetical protein
MKHMENYYFQKKECNIYTKQKQLKIQEKVTQISLQYRIKQKQNCIKENNYVKLQKGQGIKHYIPCNYN